VRAYLRIGPTLVEDKEADGYAPAAIAAFIALLCEAEKQEPRGRFRNLRILRAHLGQHARWVNFMVAQQDLEALLDGSFYVVGWDEWQEGNWKVAERMQRMREVRADRNKGDGGDRNGVAYRLPLTASKYSRRGRMSAKRTGEGDESGNGFVDENAVLANETLDTALIDQQFSGGCRP